MKLHLSIAARHLSARKRQSIVSLLGIILGVGFFLAISSMMRGSEKDFIKQLVDNSPHITISDDFREPRPQPLFERYQAGAVEIRSVRPVSETRGIRGYEGVIEFLRAIPGTRASPLLVGQALVTFAGRDLSITLNGTIPRDMTDVSTIHEKMISGTVDDLIANPEGILLGSELAKKISVGRGDTITIVAPNGNSRVFKVLGLFRTGRRGYDESQAFADLKRVQALMGRVHRANSIIIKVADPWGAQRVSEYIERRIGYKSISWQESSEDLMNTLRVRNTIMYTVVSAVLVVAAFGIYNVISTVVAEKHRDIAILKSIGFEAWEIKRIFVVQGILLGLVGCSVGLPFGTVLMVSLMQIRFRPPGASEPIQMPIDWGWEQFLIAAAFAMTASILAGYLPARRASHVQPVDILRGNT